MTQPSRVFAVLNLFSAERPVWHADEIHETLGYTRATGYRCVKQLVEAGFLQKVAAGRYALGARIIELDYQLRRSDPLLLAAVPVMDELARRTRLDAVLTAMFGTRIVDTYRASGGGALELAYGRGRPRPLFSGAAAKAILSCLPRPQLQRLYKTHPDDVAVQGLGTSWPEFRAHLTAIRKRAFYRSRGELEPGVDGAAVPLPNPDGEVVAALALVGKPSALDAAGEASLASWLAKASQEIQARLAHDGAGAPPRSADPRPTGARPSQ